MGTLLGDLKVDGLLDNTLVLCMGEFRRTVGPLNGQQGRDHYQQRAVIWQGPGFRVRWRWARRMSGAP